MRQRLFTHLADLITRFPARVILAAAIVAALAWRPVGRLVLTTDRFDLVPAGDPSVKAYAQFNASFGALNEVFLILTGPPEQTRRAADVIADGLAADHTTIRAVTHRVDVEHLKGQALYALSPRALASLVDVLEAEGPLLAAVARHPTASSLVREMTGEVADDTGPPPTAREAEDGVAMMAGVLDSIESALRTRSRPLPEPGSRVFPDSPLDAIDRAFKGLDSQGYLTSKDGRRRLLIVTPAQPPEAPRATEHLMTAIHRVADPTLATTPGVTMGIAGGPIQDRDEERTVSQDLRRTSALAWLGVLLLSWFAFRSILAAIMANVCLALAVYLTLAAAQLVVGQLNVISGVFVAILVGLGIDFGIYVFSLYLEALPHQGRTAMRWALSTGGPGITTGALTIAAAFFSLCVHRFRAFRELGIIAGMGVLLAFLAMLIVFPALVVLCERFFARSPSSTLSRIVVRSLQRLPSRRRTILPVAAVALAILALGVGRVGFDYDLSDLQSGDSDAIRWERVLHEEFGLSSDFIVVLSNSLAEAARASARLGAASAIASVDGMDALVPADAPAKAAAVKRVGALVRALDPRVPRSAPHDDRGGLDAALDAFSASLGRLRSLAGMEESTRLQAAVDALERRLASTRHTLDSATKGAADGALAFWAESLRQSLDRAQDLLRRAGTVEPYTPDSVPPGLASHYRGKDRRLATYVWAASDISTPEGMRDFVEQASAAGPHVAGIPIMVYRMLEMIRVGYIQASIPSMIVIVVLVLADFRKPWLTAGALLPMLCGVLATVGWMGLWGQRWNPLSSIALPVMLGVGVSFGVNLVHRWRVEGDMGAVLAGTGRAVVFSAFASMIGFGSLLLADHRGLASFGRTMTVAVAAQLITAVVILPCFLDAVSAP